MKEKILVIDDESSIRFTLGTFLSDEGYEVRTAEDYYKALSLISEMDFDLIFADIILGGKTGIDLLREVKERKLRCPVIIITGDPNIKTASDAVRLGAFDYITKPVRKNDIIHIAKVALQYKSLYDKSEKYRSNLEAIFRSVKDGIVTVDKELTVVEINEAARSICGFSSDIVGKSLYSLSHDCEGKCVEAIVETVEKRQSVEKYRLECRHKGRPDQVITLTTSPLIDSNGVFSGAVMVVRDETPLAALERDMEERRQFHNIVGRSKKMQEIYSLIESLADVPTTVLITGESGTGKELVAEALHYKGVRSDKPLVKVNCSALPENLLESELFGHIKGAFTGAIKDKIGRFQKADGGTIFLDEIGDMSHSMQLRLLRVLQNMEFERVGDSTPVKVDVRVIAATNQQLSERVRLGKFREDLYYRLKVVELNLPPLRDRLEDIPLLVDHFIKQFNNKLNKDITSVSEEVQKMFMEYMWPGNIRELEHTLEHAFILCRHSMITVENLPPDFRIISGTRAPLIKEETDYTQEILKALEKTGGNKAKAARLLGISRRTLYRKMEEYGIKNDEII